MFRRGLLVRAAAAVNASQGLDEGMRANDASVESPSNGSDTRATLLGLYRRLLKAGEDGAMMQHTLSVHPLPHCIKQGVKLLQLHKGLTDTDTRARQTSLFHPLRRARLGLWRRIYAWRLFYLRLSLRSWNAISDALVYTLFVVTCVFLYEIYRTCRVGVTRAEERYRTLAIPIIQTFDALEASQERKRKLHAEMEDDILRNR